MSSGEITTTDPVWLCLQNLEALCEVFERMEKGEAFEGDTLEIFTKTARKNLRRCGWPWPRHAETGGVVEP